jgi:hypothetical protein
MQEEAPSAPYGRKTSPPILLNREAKNSDNDGADDARWDPIAFVDAMGERAVGRIQTAFPRKNGCPRQVLPNRALSRQTV